MNEQRWVPNYVASLRERLRSAGHAAYPVGGCVRDLLLGKTPEDWDMTTDARPEEMLELFGSAAHPTGLRHGTVTIVSEGHNVEVTTMRRDGSYRDLRHPESVTFTASLSEDLARRDFTVNAMALGPEGEVLDPFGGRADLERRVLRCVGEPEERFGEDALRILRLLRFASVLGFAAEERAAAAAREKRELLGAVAAERVYAELNKLLCGAGAAEVLLAFPEVLGVWLPEVLPCVGFEQHSVHHCYDVWGHTARSVGAVAPERALRWTMLLHDLGKPGCFTLDGTGAGHFYGHTALSAALAEGVMERLRFEKKLAKRVRAQLECFDDRFAPDRASVHREMTRRGPETVRCLLLTKQADNAAKAPEGLERAQAPWREAQKTFDALTAEGACCSLRELRLNGADLRELGFEGAAVGAVLNRLLDEVSGETLPNRRDALLNRAKRLRRSGAYTDHLCPPLQGGQR